MKIKIIILLIFVIVFAGGLGYFFLIKNNGSASTENTLNLLSQTDSQDGISFNVKPVEFNFENPIKFEIKIDTHSGSLDFDLTEISFLEDDKGNKYQPLEWQGPEPGGHHRFGTLIFSKLNNQTKTFKLIIQDNYLRIFEWELE